MFLQTFATTSAHILSDSYQAAKCSTVCPNFAKFTELPAESSCFSAETNGALRAAKLDLKQ